MRRTGYLSWAVFLAAAALLSGCPCGTDELPVTLTAFSGRFGYYLSGPYGFDGSLTKENLGDAEWTLEGTFQFPTSGYAMLGPEILVMESYPEQVTVRMRVVPPPAGSVVLQVITPRTVTYKITASDQAAFTISVEEYCL